MLHLTHQRVQLLKQMRTGFQGDVSSSKTLAELLLGFMELYAGRLGLLLGSLYRAVSWHLASLYVGRNHFLLCNATLTKDMTLDISAQVPVTLSGRTGKHHVL